jgi:hypothetical protein
MNRQLKGRPEMIIGFTAGVILFVGSIVIGAICFFLFF